ncbi:hypothetical protein [Conexibacter sp. CPCC 206217]|uniref:hypothetical protein n=1 Tax=Conexibacter sp. CPCC 206217 TaxID=3064574 RepID=UPI0027203050|nr:hypothetical protein [Conexibacter sp. CPCC 206217]MDO8210645.1 hypothetical protein [Conexibacter sp. CPCC 206217]
MPTRLLLAAAAAALLAAPAAAGAATTLPVGEAHGVRIVQGRDGATIVFTRRANGLWRQLAGRTIEVGCTQLGPPGGAGIMQEGITGGAMRAPKQRRPLPVGPADSDYCTVALRYENDRMLMIDPVVRIPVTQAGAIALDESEKSALLIGALGMASTLGNGGNPSAFSTPAQLTRGLGARMLKREGMSVVALAAATDTPRAGEVGYWSDGALHAAAVTLSAAGRRLYVELGPEGELRTNVARSIFAIDE